MPLIKTLILGIVQGLTEWLPISSTGHLRLFELHLDMEVPILFDVILHVGTLIVVLLFFRERISQVLSSLVDRDFKTENGRLIPLLIVGAIPTAVIGVAFGGTIENTFQTVLPIALAFIFCGIVLLAVKFGKEKTRSIEYSTAALIGIAQGIAIIPGVSRSGMTVAVALLVGIERKKAFEFSFLLSIPAMLGALAYTTYSQFGELVSTGLGFSEILAGTLVSMFVGYIALKLLWKILAKKKFYLFAFYCWTLGVLLVLL